MLLLSFNKLSEANTVRKPLVKPLMELLSTGSSRIAPEPLLIAIRPGCQKVAPEYPAGEAAGLLTMPSDGVNRRFASGKSRLLLKLIGATAGLTLSALGNAVGLGGINVVSALGQPLMAEIELVAVGKAEKPSLVARLASSDAYKDAGLDYPYGIKYSFQIGSRANGEPYLKLSSNREVSDPFVSLLVELSWSSGKLLREYTFLLDPPGYVAAQPKSAAVQATAPVTVQSVPLIATAAKREEEKPLADMSAARPVEKQVVAAPAKPEQAGRANVAAGAITVMSGDSLNKIAARTKPDEVSLERMLVALYRANANQFDGKNMNRIQSGKILRIPDQDEVMQVAQPEAVQEIRTHTADWSAYRQKLAATASTSHKTEATRQVATGKITSLTTDKAPAASESSKEVLRLSKGEAPGDKALPGAAGRGAQDRRNAAAEDAIAKSKAASESKTRAALLESNQKDMQRLAQLKTEAAALTASAAASRINAASAVAAASEVAAASVAVSQVAAASAIKPAAAEEPSLMDKLLASPLSLGIVAAVLLGGLGVALSRRKRAPADVSGSADEVITPPAHLAVPVMPSPDTGDFTVAVSRAEEVAPRLDEVDPISEADLFLNFGRDEQAEEVLKDAILRSPDNHQYLRQPPGCEFILGYRAPIA
jgi:pilus assembly protein FimV